jgi:hypothetical protein
MDIFRPATGGPDLPCRCRSGAAAVYIISMLIDKENRWN